MLGIRPSRAPLGILAAIASALLCASTVMASTPGTDVRLTKDAPSLSGYVSADDLAGLAHYTDPTLNECSRSRGRQNEPALATTG